jgi:hypothetical protein
MDSTLAIEDNMSVLFRAMAVFRQPEISAKVDPDPNKNAWRSGRSLTFHSEGSMLNSCIQSKPRMAGLLDLRRIAGIVLVLGASTALAKQPVGQFALADINPHNVDVSQDRNGLRVSMPRKFWQDPAREKLSDRDFMALLPVDFDDGTIEAEVMSTVDPQAPDFARGFVGFAFRVADGRFEKIYLRPTNGVADDQVRRNHSVQYAAFPDFRFDRLRAESPERYETAADIAPGRWINVRIEVSGAKAKLYLDRRTNPTLIVNDLKLGADRRGKVGLWIESGTIAHFRNIRITPAHPTR